MDTGERNWAGLPSDILNLIAQRLIISDHARLCAVCTSWAAALSDSLPLASHFPWLMLMRSEENNGSKLSFFSPIEARYYPLSHFPKIHGRYRFVGYKDGWLVILHESLDLCLVNPLTGAQVHLPPFSTLHDFEDRSYKYVNKVVLANIPAAVDGYVAVAIYNFWQSLAYARPGNAVWTPLYILPKGSYIEDIVYHTDKFFVLCSDGQLHSFRPLGPYLEASLFMKSSIGQGHNRYLSDYSSFLVSSCSGDLLHVKAAIMTREIRVMRFESDIDSCWVETKDLGDQSLFLDSKYAMSVSASDIPQLKRNCIFTISESSDYIGNVTAFDIEKQVTWPCLPLNISYRFFRPIWIMPSLLGTRQVTSKYYIYFAMFIFPIIC